MRTREKVLKRKKVREMDGQVREKNAFAHWKTPIKTPISALSARSAHILEDLGKYEKRERERGEERREKGEKSLEFWKIRALRALRAFSRITAEDSSRKKVRELKTFAHLMRTFAHFGGRAA